MSFEEEFSSAFAQQLRFDPTREISDLSDEDFAEIFKRLPPLDRLLISEVCKRWNRISRRAWLEITQLDLSPIPCANIAAVIKHCPDLSVVSARGKIFDPKALWGLSSCVNLSSLKFYDCTIHVAEEGLDSVDEEELFCNKFWDCRVYIAENGFDPNDPLELLWKDDATQLKFKELILQNVKVFAGHPDRKPLEHFIAFIKLPERLDRLQLSGPLVMQTWLAEGIYFPRNLEPLQNLTCLILNAPMMDPNICESIAGDGSLDDARYLLALSGLKQLRELCIGLCTQEAFADTMQYLLELPFDLPRLEVLFLNNVLFGSENDLADLATKHPTLRVLVLTGSFINEECTIPTRHLYPNGFAAESLPLLHVFLGKKASERILFEASSTDALKIYPISTPLPTFLDHVEIKPIFERVWIAEQIKEGAKLGAEWWNYDQDVATSFRRGAA